MRKSNGNNLIKVIHGKLNIYIPIKKRKKENLQLLTTSTNYTKRYKFGQGDKINITVLLCQRDQDTNHGVQTAKINCKLTFQSAHMTSHNQLPGNKICLKFYLSQIGTVSCAIFSSPVLQRDSNGQTENRLTTSRGVR